MLKATKGELNRETMTNSLPALAAALGNETAIASAFHLIWTGHVVLDFVEKGNFSKALYHVVFLIFSYINLY